MLEHVVPILSVFSIFGCILAMAELLGVVLACCLPSNSHTAFIYQNLPYQHEGYVALLSALFMAFTLIALIGLWSLVEISSKKA